MLCYCRQIINNTIKLTQLAICILVPHPILWGGTLVVPQTFDYIGPLNPPLLTSNLGQTTYPYTKRLFRELVPSQMDALTFYDPPGSLYTSQTQYK